MKQVFVIIGYREETIMKDDLDPECITNALIGQIVSKVESVSEIQPSMKKALQEYPYAKVETLWEKS